MTVTIRHGDCREVLRTMPDRSVHCCVTSPPYWGLRDYGVAGQIGLEATPAAFVAEMVEVFEEVRRVLRDDGTLWLNLGDSYMGGGRGGGADNCKQRTNVGSLDAAPNQRVAGYKQKDLVGVPWMVAFALRAAGWYLRQDIIWSKPNPMPESVTDRCTKAHEYIFLMSKSARYYYDAAAVSEPAVKAGLILHSYGTGAKDRQDVSDVNDRRTRIGLANWNQAQPDTRNKRSVWEVSTQSFPEAHFATFPPALIEPCILAGCPIGGTVLDPFGGAGTTGMVSDRLGRDAILIELNPEYAAIAENRIRGDAGMFADVGTVSDTSQLQGGK
jgi:DNA modification methylase